MNRRNFLKLMGLGIVAPTAILARPRNLAHPTFNAIKTNLWATEVFEAAKREVQFPWRIEESLSRCKKLALIYSESFRRIKFDNKNYGVLCLDVGK